MGRSRAKTTSKGGRRGRQRQWLIAGAGSGLALVWLVAGVVWEALPNRVRGRAGAVMPTVLVTALDRAGGPAWDLADDLGFTGRDVTVPTAGAAVPAANHVLAGVPTPADGPPPWDAELVSEGFTVGYSERHRTPIWVAYRLMETDLRSSPPRPDRFTADGRTRNPVAHDEYRDTGYDRGHMAPNYAIATRFGRAGQRETFRMSNICPQRPGLNRGLWRRLEQRVARDFAQRRGEVWVLCGPVFEPPDDALPSGVAIPDRFFKIVVDETDDALAVFAVLVPQEVLGHERIARYLVSVDRIEALTGIDFFPELPDGVETALESRAATRLWPGGIRAWVRALSPF